MERKQYVLELSRNAQKFIPENIMAPSFRNNDSEVTLSYLSERLKLYNGVVFAHAVRRVPKSVPNSTQIRWYMERIRYYDGQNQMAVWLNWRKRCRNATSSVYLQQNCVDFVYYVLIDMGLLPPKAYQCHLPHELSGALDENGELLFDAAVRVS